MTGGAELAERFAAALARVGGEAVVCADRADVAARLRAVADGRPVVADEHPDLAGLLDGLPVVADPWAAEVGVTGVLVAAADTGTLAIAAAPGRPRSISLVPPVHVAVVPFDRLVADYAELVTVVGTQRPLPSGVQLVTGPSKSADIEMRLVTGVHGPVRVVVLLHPPATPGP